MYNQENCKFLPSHEWAFVEGDTVVCGISEHAQHEISDIVFVDMPKVGLAVTQGKACCVIESVKSANDIYAPVSGEIVEVNSAVAADPSLVNKEAHGAGWLFKIKMSNPSELDTLLTFDAYQATIK